jgi:N-acetylglutamate synthase-like GNAT family acetyltransferase
MQILWRYLKLMTQKLNITLRRARVNETKVLSELSMRSKRSNGYDDAFMAACKQELTVTEERIRDGEYWVADAGMVCGCGCLLADPASRSGEIHAFFIDPDCQRSGIGFMLWQKLLERAKAKGLEKLHLDADPNAVPFYEAIGFKISGETPSGSISGRSLPYMTYSITGIESGV